MLAYVMSANHPQVSEQLESCESSGGDAPLTDTTATLPQAAILSSPAVSEQLESCELSGGDAPLTDTLPPASVPSPPVVRTCFELCANLYIVWAACYELFRSYSITWNCLVLAEQICSTRGDTGGF